MINKKTSSSHQLIEGLSFCVFDLETTGGNHKSDKIIEIGLVKIEKMKIVARKNYLIQPEIKIPDFIQKLTTITHKDVKTAPIIEDVIDEILEFMGESILVAHNTSFDVPFFNSVLRRLGKEELKNKAICTHLMTKYLIPNLMNTNLNYMSKIFGISHNQAHRALDDAEATANLLIKYLKIFIAKDIPKINHLYYPRNRYELDRINYKKSTDFSEIKNKIYEIKSSSLITLKGENGVILFSYPLSPASKENPETHFVLQHIEEMDWEMLTIRMTGPFIESLIHFTPLFNKLEAQLKFDVINQLWKSHIQEDRPCPSDSSDEGLSEVENDKGLEDHGDFLIAHHLVPEQLIIYPLLTLEPKSSLVFRYPGHQKKMLQFIHSKANKLDSKRIKRVHHHTLLKDFLYAYLEKEKIREGLFFFKSKSVDKKGDKFIAKLDEYLNIHPNPYHYPNDYV